MTAHVSKPDLLALHAVRLRGMADTASAAARFDLGVDATEERLLDAQAFGWVTWSQFAGSGGWSLTSAGREQNERELADELAAARAATRVGRVHASFVPLNARLQRACTDWQLRPTATDPLAANEHTDARWDRAVLAELAGLSSALAPLVRGLSDVLARFDGYGTRFATALGRVQAGRPRVGRRERPRLLPRGLVRAARGPDRHARALAHVIVGLRDAEDPQVVGRKAATLGRLLRAGFDVPPGFVVARGRDRPARSSRTCCGRTALSGPGWWPSARPPPPRTARTTPRPVATTASSVSRARRTCSRGSTTASARCTGPACPPTVVVVVRWPCWCSGRWTPTSPGVVATVDPLTGASPGGRRGVVGARRGGRRGPGGAGPVPGRRRRSRGSPRRRESRSQRTRPGRHHQRRRAARRPVTAVPGRHRRAAGGRSGRPRRGPARRAAGRGVGAGRRAPRAAPGAAAHRAAGVRATRAPGPAGAVLLRGTPASRGRARGVARVVTDPAGAGGLRPGEVLVCRTTDPSWTPLLSVASAVVTETGGVLAHAAIVARERGIPAVVGVAGACDRPRHHAAGRRGRRRRDRGIRCVRRCRWPAGRGVNPVKAAPPRTERPRRDQCAT